MGEEGVVEAYRNVTETRIACPWDTADRVDTQWSSGGVFEDESRAG